MTDNDARLSALYPTMKFGRDDTDAAPADDAVLALRYGAQEYQPLTTSARAMTPEEHRYGIDGGALANLESSRELGLHEWYEDMEFTPADQQQMTAALRHVGAEIGLTRGEVGELVGALSGALRTPVDDETLAAWTAENERRLSQMHGPSWRDSLADVNRLLSRHPDLRDIMNEARITSNPRIVDLFIAKARSMKMQRGAL